MPDCNPLHKALSRPENDADFKVHVLQELDGIKKSGSTREKKQDVFNTKIKICAALIIGAIGLKGPLLKFLLAQV